MDHLRDERVTAESRETIHHTGGVNHGELRELVLATNNQAKLRELQRIIDEMGLPIRATCLKDYPRYVEPAETAHSFQGNALIKARAAVSRLGIPALADDSGLAVDVLNQMPGVRSSRWAGPECDDDKNLDLVLAQIDDVPDSQRQARFVSAVAFVTPDGLERTEVGEMEGRLIRQRRGSNGFGYDPIFVADGHTRTNGELSAEEKDAISHRGKALRQIMPIVATWMGVVDPAAELPDSDPLGPGHGGWSDSLRG